MANTTTKILLAAAIGFGLSGCTGDVGGVTEEAQEYTSDADPDPADGQYGALSNTFSAGDSVKVCNCHSGLNQRTGASTGYMILRVISPGATGKVVSKSGSWYRWTTDGDTGWSYGYYLCATSSSSGSTSPSGSGSGSGSSGSSSGGTSGYGVSRDGIIGLAKALLHFSYWWGGAAYKVGSTSYGKCYSSTYGGHSGSYGGDCSGYVGKVWQLSEALPLEKNLHPYSTYAFKNGSTHWSSISRSSAKRADAMVHNESGSGHVLIYESGDAWGQAWTYESRGCSYGSVHNSRTIGSTYVARHRDGV
jgi:hypothetical protein